MNYWLRPSFELNNVSSIDKENELIIRVCKLRGVTIEELKSKKRQRNIVESRFIIFYILVEYCNYSLTQAGDLFNRDHSTVHYAKTTVKSLMTFDKRMNSEISSLMDFVRYNFQIVEPAPIEKRKSKYVGVSWYKERHKWVARKKINGKMEYLGLYDDEYLASLAYQNETVNRIYKLKL